MIKIFLSYLALVLVTAVAVYTLAMMIHYCKYRDFTPEDDFRFDFWNIPAEDETDAE